MPERQPNDHRVQENLEALVYTLIGMGESRRVTNVDYLSQLPVSGNQINDFITVYENGFVYYWTGTERRLVSSLLGVPNNPNDLGWFPTPVELNLAHPTSTDGKYATVGNTDSIWVWNSDGSDWVDSGQSVTVSPSFKITIENDGDTSFTLTSPVILPGSNVRLYLNGQKQNYNIDYEFTDSLTLLRKSSDFDLQTTDVLELYYI